MMEISLDVQSFSNVAVEFHQAIDSICKTKSDFLRFKNNLEGLGLFKLPPTPEIMRMSDTEIRELASQLWGQYVLLTSDIRTIAIQ